MLSIFKPDPEIDPRIKKKIDRLSILAIAFSICALALMWIPFLMPAPPTWAIILPPFVLFIAMHLSGKAYRLRNPRRS